MKILIVDDEPDLRSLMAMVIENSLKTPTVLAESIKSAIELLNTDTDIGGIICDYQLPDAHGKDLLQFLKSKNLKTPIILCSGNPVEYEPEIKDYVVSGFILKPFTKKEIIEKARTIFGIGSP